MLNQFNLITLWGINECNHFAVFAVVDPSLTGTPSFLR